MDKLSGLTDWPSITEQAYRRVRGVLLEGAYLPGARLSEVALAARLEVSRGPVREALERLAQEGLVVRVPRRGTYVRRYDRAEVRELMELRRVLDTAAVRLAIVRADDDALSRVHALQDAAEAVIARGSGYPPDKDFHQAVVRLARNRELERSAGLVYDQLRLARSLSAQGSRARAAWREHAAILRALLARDAAAAEEAVAAHLQAAEAAILELAADAGARDDGQTRGVPPGVPT